MALNVITLIGRLTRDPELRYSPSGVAVCKFGLAVDRDRRNKDGEKETDFFDVLTFNKQAEVVNTNLQKGRLVGVNGSIQIRNYESNGVKGKAVEVVANNVQFLDYPKDGNGNSGGGNNGNNRPPNNQPPNNGYNGPPAGGGGYVPPSNNGYNGPPNGGYNGPPPNNGYNGPPNNGYGGPPNNQSHNNAYNGQPGGPPNNGYNGPPGNGQNQGGYNGPSGNNNQWSEDDIPF